MRTLPVRVPVVLSLAVTGLPSWAVDEACGDPPFDECGPDESCARFTGFCAAPYPFGVCKETGVNCSAHWDPICGCDLQVYTNYCTALSVGVSVAGYGGGCSPGCGPGIPCDPGLFCFTPLGQCSGHPLLRG